MSKPDVNFLDAFLSGDVSSQTLETGNAPNTSQEVETMEQSSLSKDVDEENNASGFKVKQYTEPEDDGKEDTPSSEDTEEKASGSFALAFAKFQQDEGVISEFDEETLLGIEKRDGVTGALRYLLDVQAEYLKEEARQMYADDKAELEEYFRLKDLGVDAKTAQELAYSKKQWENATDDDLELDESFRRDVLTEHFKATTKFKADRIERMVDAIFNNGDDLEESMSALKELQHISKEKRETAEKNIKEQERLYKESLKSAREDFKKSVMDRDEYIKGIKVNKTTKDKIIKMVLEPAAKDAQGNPINGVWAERAKDPGKFDAFVAYHLINGTLYGDLENVKKRIKTEVTSNFEEMLRTRGDSISGGNRVSSTKYDTSLLDRLIGK